VRARRLDGRAGALHEAGADGVHREEHRHRPGQPRGVRGAFRVREHDRGHHVPRVRLHLRRHPLLVAAQPRDLGRAGRHRIRLPERPRPAVAALLMEIINNLMFGFSHALTMHNLMYVAIGCFVGTIVGLLPGLGPLATISLLLPLTFSIPTGGALIMLAGIYYGAQYGDSVSAITMKIPHASSIVACIDGYQMTLNGQTGLALFTAGVSSFIGGTVAIVVLSFFAP